MLVRYQLVIIMRGLIALNALNKTFNFLPVDQEEGPLN